MDYSDSAEGVMISETRAHQELKAHGMMPEDHERFEAEVKCDGRGMYDAGKVLEWLGY